MLEFGSPLWLWLLLLVPGIWFSARGSFSPLTGSPRKYALALRTVILICLVLAAADLRWVHTNDQTAVLVLVDNSASVNEDGLAQATAFIAGTREHAGAGRLATASLAPVPRMVAAFDDRDVETLEIELAELPGTDLTHALEWSGLHIKAGSPTRVVILTDGMVANESDTLRAIESSILRGVPVDIVRLNPDRSAEVELGAVHIPHRLEPGRPFDLPVTIRSTVEQPVSIQVFQNDLLVREATHTVDTGESVIKIPALVPDAGASNWRIQLIAADDSIPGNNALERFASAKGGTRVLMIDPDPAALSAAVRAAEQAGMEAEARRPGEFPATLDALASFDIVVLSDTSAAALGAQRMALLAEWVRSAGGGLLVAGGPNAFAAGGYFGTPLAEMIPVVTDYVDRAELSVAALYVSLDRSGSMGAPVAGTTKMALANAGAVRAMELLDRNDLFGLAAVDTEVHSILPLQPVSDRAGASRLIQSINAGGGGIYIFTALTAAYRELSAADARIKHLIIFSDAADAEEQTAPPGAGIMATALDLASAMRAARMTVSVVALGAETDQDTAFLRTLAASGGGRFYLTSDATTLPRIFAEETLRATQSSLVEEPFLAVVGLSDTAIAGIDWDSAPDLFGYNAVQARPLAEPILLTEAGTPLMASWRFGLGRVTAFTSDINGRWSFDWLGWPGFGQWFVQTLRSLVPPGDPAGISISSALEGETLVVKIEARNPDGSFRPGLLPEVSLTDGRRPVSATAADPVGAGQYEAVFKLPAYDSGLISVTVGDEPVLASWSRPPTSEAWVLRNPDDFFAAAVERGGGAMDPEPEAVFRPSGLAVATTTPLVPWLLLLAILLWPVDIWIRRRDRSDTLSRP